MAKPRIFVSHSHQDDLFTAALVDELTSAGAEVWVDVADMGSGDFIERIDAALSQSEWVVLVLTKAALASPWVKQEVNAAIRLKHQGRVRDILPVRADSVDLETLPPMWGVFNVFDAMQNYPAALTSLLRVLGLVPIARNFNSPEPQMERNALIQQERRDFYGMHSNDTPEGLHQFEERDETRVPSGTSHDWAPRSWYEPQWDATHPMWPYDTNQIADSDRSNVPRYGPAEVASSPQASISSSGPPAEPNPRASNALFDDASLPEWLRQSGAPPTDPPSISQVLPPSGPPAEPNPRASNALFDDASLPEWLRQSGR